MNKNMNSNLTFRDFEDEDAYNCCLLIERCVPDYEGINQDAYAKFKSRTHKSKFLDYVKLNCKIVCKINEKIIGMGGTEGDMIKLMYVDPEYRLKGIGKEIHNRLEKHQSNQDIKEVRIDASINAIPL